MEEYDENGLQIIDPFEVVRRHKRLFLRGGEVAPEEMATEIANDALTIGVTKVEVHHHGDWWLVCSPDDWLEMGHSYRELGDGYKYTIEELFRHLVPLEGNNVVNSVRREILLTAFAEDVFAKKDKEFLWVKGGSKKCEGELGSYLKSIPDHYRVVGFRLAVRPSRPTHDS